MAISVEVLPRISTNALGSSRFPRPPLSKKGCSRVRDRFFLSISTRFFRSIGGAFAVWTVPIASAFTPKT